MQGFPQPSLTMGQEGRSVQAAGVGQAVKRGRTELHGRFAWDSGGCQQRRGRGAPQLIKPSKCGVCARVADIVAQTTLAHVHNSLIEAHSTLKVHGVSFLD